MKQVRLSIFDNIIMIKSHWISVLHANNHLEFICFITHHLINGSNYNLKLRLPNVPKIRGNFYNKYKCI